jgi:GNAT superfamily N-acetyltransferase
VELSDFLFDGYAKPQCASHEGCTSFPVSHSNPILSSCLPTSPHASAVAYAVEPNLSPEEFIDVLRRSTLGQRRPVDRPDVISKMLRRADVIVTARAGELLVGVSRAISDLAYCTYLSDLAVDTAYQKRGIGRELIRRTHEAAGRETTLILLAAPAARTYYPHVGMKQHESAWIIPGGDWRRTV